jgi:hypothetical protein
LSEYSSEESLEKKVTPNRKGRGGTQHSSPWKSRDRFVSGDATEENKDESDELDEFCAASSWETSSAKSDGKGLSESNSPGLGKGQNAFMNKRGP